MRRFISIAALLFSVLYSDTALSQDTVRLPKIPVIDSLIKATTESLLQSGIDSIVSLNVHTGSLVPFFDDTLKDYGMVTTFSNTYILFEKNKNWFFIRFVSCAPDSSIGELILQSKPLVNSSDASLNIFKKKLKKINNEDFLPFMIEIEENGVKGYSPGGETDTEYYELTLTTKNTSITKRFWEFNLYERYRYVPDNLSPKNINFAFNKSLNLYAVFFKLKDLFQKNDRNFSFK